MPSYVGETYVSYMADPISVVWCDVCAHTSVWRGVTFFGPVCSSSNALAIQAVGVVVFVVVTTLVFVRMHAYPRTQDACVRKCVHTGTSESLAPAHFSRGSNV